VPFETDLEKIDVPFTNLPARVRTDQPAVWETGGRIPLEVLYSFVSLDGRSSGGHVIAFTSARRQEGVTHVVRQLGQQLAAYCREDVLIISPPDLRRLRVPDAERIQILGQRVAPGLWTVPGDLAEREEHSSNHAQEDLWKTLRGRFRYVLFDCSALESSGDVLSLAPRIDGTVLVVRAGFTPKPEVQKAARLLSLGSSPFLGCILNARTYPVPGFLYRIL
jgi:hypothetical protein